MSNTQDLGHYIPQVRAAGVRLNANEPLVVADLATFSGGATFSAGTVNFTGATVTGLTSGVESIVATSANAFLVGQTSANPAININTNTATSATGFNITSAAAASGAALTVISSGTN